MSCLAIINGFSFDSILNIFINYIKIDILFPCMYLSYRNWMYFPVKQIQLPVYL